MAEEEAEKTETATPKRREEARNKGEVAQSREIQHVVILTAAMLALGSSLGIGVVTALSDVARSSWSAIGAPPETLADFRSLLLGHVSHPALAVLPIMLLFAAAGTASQVLQTGPLLSSEALAFKALGEAMPAFAGMKYADLYSRSVRVAEDALTAAAN